MCVGGRERERGLKGVAGESVCVCVCVCVRERERENLKGRRERETERDLAYVLCFV